MKTATHVQRQQALATPGMKALLSELARAKSDHAHACVKAAPPTYARTPARRCRDSQVHALAQRVNQLEADITRSGGACLLAHDEKEKTIGAMVVTAVVFLTLVLGNATKNSAALLVLPLVGAVPIAMKATERFR